MITAKKLRFFGGATKQYLVLSRHNGTEETVFDIPQGHAKEEAIETFTRFIKMERALR